MNRSKSLSEVTVLLRRILETVLQIAMEETKALISRWRAPKPQILRPYSNPHPPLARRLARMTVVPLLSFFCLIYGFIYALVAPYLLFQIAFPLIVLAILVVWALPEVFNPPDRTLEILLFTFFCSLIVWPNYLAITLPSLPWITMLRLVGFPMLFALLLCVSTSTDFRTRLMNTMNATPLVWKALCVFVVIQIITLPMSSNPGQAVNRLIVAQISWTAVFFASCYVFAKPGRIMRWVAILWVMVIFICLIGVYENMIGRVAWAGHVPNFLRIEDDAVLRIMSGQARAAMGTHRTQATFSTSLGLAEYIALTTPFVLHFLSAHHKTSIRLAAAASLPLMFYVVIVTQSRLGVVGFFLAILLYTLCTGALIWLRNPKSLLGPALVLSYPAIAVGFLVSTFVVGRLRNMVWGNGAHQASNQSRIEQYQDGIVKIAKNPFGHGISSAGEVLGFSNAAGVVTIDTYYILIGIEYGVLGFIFYYGMFFASVYYGGKTILDNRIPDRESMLIVPTVIALVSFLVIKSIFSNPDNHPLAFMMLAIVAALVQRGAAMPSQATASSGGNRSHGFTARRLIAGSSQTN